MAGPVNRPSVQAATRSVGVEAASTAGPPRLVQGGCHGTQVPRVRRGPLTTTRAVCTTEPEPPWSTICATGIGPAPSGSFVGESCQASRPAGVVRMSKMFAESKTTAWATPPDAARSETVDWPPTGRVGRAQCDPPSWVTQRSGPKAQPLPGSANRSFRTPGPPCRLSDTGGPGSPAQVWPPSRVRSTETVHVGQVAPRTQPVCGDTNVTDAGAKPLGSGPPGGPAAGVDVGVGTVAGGETVEVGEAEPVTVGAGVGLPCGPAAGWDAHPASATVAAMARTCKAFTTDPGPPAGAVP